MRKNRRNRTHKGLGVVSFLLILLVMLVQGCGKQEDGKQTENDVTPGATEVSVTPEATATPVPTKEPMPTVTLEPQEKLLLLSERELTVQNELYFEFCYLSESVVCRSEDTDIAQVMLMECGYDPEEEAEVAGIMIYGIKNGETEIVIADGENRQVVRRKVTVEKPEEDTGKQRLIDWLFLHGDTDEIGDKVLTKGTAEAGGMAMVEYATMDENINFYYKELRDGENIEWNLIPTPEENTEYYITMRMGEEFVTATVDLVTYNNETVAFEKGWFRVPVEEEVQNRAEEVSKRAYEAVRTLLLEETGMRMGEVCVAE